MARNGPFELRKQFMRDGHLTMQRDSWSEEIDPLRSNNESGRWSGDGGNFLRESPQALPEESHPGDIDLLERDSLSDDEDLLMKPNAVMPSILSNGDPVGCEKKKEPVGRHHPVRGGPKRERVVVQDYAFHYEGDRLTVEKAYPARVGYETDHEPAKGYGRLSVDRAHTMKDFEKQITELKKENFNLKLRIYFLEEQVQRHCDNSSEELHRMNIELKVEVESLKHEYQEKQNLLIRASKAMESLAGEHNFSIQHMRDDHLKQLQDLEEASHQKIQLLEGELNQEKAELEKICRLMDQERMQRFSAEERLLAVEQQYNQSVGILEERDWIIQCLNETLRSKDALIAQLEKQISTMMPSDTSAAKTAASLPERDLKEQRSQSPGLTCKDCLATKTSEGNVIEWQKKVKEMGDVINELQQKLEESKAGVAAEEKNSIKRDKAIQGLTLALKKKTKENEKLLKEMDHLNAALREARESGQQDQSQHFRNADYKKLILTIQTQQDLCSRLHEYERESGGLQKELDAIAMLRKWLEKDIQSNRELRNILEAQIMAKGRESDTMSFLGDQTSYMSICLDHLRDNNNHLEGSVNRPHVISVETQTDFNTEEHLDSLQDNKLVLSVTEKHSKQTSAAVATHPKLLFTEPSQSTSSSSTQTETKIYADKGILVDIFAFGNFTDVPKGLLSDSESLALDIAKRNCEIQNDKPQKCFEPKLYADKGSLVDIFGNETSGGIKDGAKEILCDSERSTSDIGNRNSEIQNDKEECFEPKFYADKGFLVDIFGNETSAGIKDGAKEILSDSETFNSNIGKRNCEIPNDHQKSFEQKLYADKGICVDAFGNETSGGINNVAKEIFHDSESSTSDIGKINCEIQNEKQKSFEPKFYADKGILVDMFANETSGGAKDLAKEFLSDSESSTLDIAKINPEIQNDKQKSFEPKFNADKGIHVDMFENKTSGGIKDGAKEICDSESSTLNIAKRNSEMQNDKRKCFEPKLFAFGNETSRGINDRPNELSDSESSTSAIAKTNCELQNDKQQKCFSNNLTKSRIPVLSKFSLGKRPKAEACLNHRENEHICLEKELQEENRRLLEQLKCAELQIGALKSNKEPPVSWDDMDNAGMECSGQVLQGDLSERLSELSKQSEQFEVKAFQPVGDAENHITILCGLETLEKEERDSLQHSLHKELQFTIDKHSEESKSVLERHLSREIGSETTNAKFVQDDTNIAERDLSAQSLQMELQLENLRLTEQLQSAQMDIEKLQAREVSLENKSALSDLDSTYSLERDLAVQSLIQELQLENQRLVEQLKCAQVEIEKLREEKVLEDIDSSFKLDIIDAEDGDSEHSFLDKTITNAISNRNPDFEVQTNSHKFTCQNITGLCCHHDGFCIECANNQETLIFKSSSFQKVSTIQRECQLLTVSHSHRPFEDTSLSKYDLLVQSQARELSHQRQKIKESHNLSVVCSKNFINVIKAFEDLILTSSLDSNIALGFREQLTQTVEWLKELEYKLSDAYYGEDDANSDHSADSLLYTPSRLVPGHKMWADKHGCHVLGLVEDYNALRKQIMEAKTVLEETEAFIDHGVQTAVLNMTEHFANVFFEKLNRTKQSLEEAGCLMKLLWRVSLPLQTHNSYSIHQAEETSLEMTRLRKRVLEQEKLLSGMVKRVYSENQVKEDIERVILNQLAMTHEILKRAKGNLEVQVVDKH